MPDPVLRVEREGARARIVLARPEVRNAFNAELIARLRDTFLGLADEPDVRVVHIRRSLNAPDGGRALILDMHLNMRVRVRGGRFSQGHRKPL